jgi:hypothetical protein
MRRNANGKVAAKADLPAKICPVCARRFVWRRKWARDWESVKYCSARCRGAGDGALPGAVEPGGRVA